MQTPQSEQQYLCCFTLLKNKTIKYQQYEFYWRFKHVYIMLFLLGFIKPSARHQSNHIQQQKQLHYSLFIFLYLTQKKQLIHLHTIGGKLYCSSLPKKPNHKRNIGSAQIHHHIVKIIQFFSAMAIIDSWLPRTEVRASLCKAIIIIQFESSKEELSKVIWYGYILKFLASPSALLEALI